MRFVIVTGLSGAGKTQVVHAMEDMGYYCIDNMPPALLVKFAEMCYKSKGKIEKVALVIDLRGGYLFYELFHELEKLSNEGYQYEILFLEANEETLIKRYKETRRRHPLSPEGRVTEGILREKELLQDIRGRADHIIDTTDMPTRKLKEKIVQLYSDSQEEQGLAIDVTSFGFKYGIPLDCDLVFDVRFLPNPFYIEGLKEKSGLDQEVRDFVFSYEQTNEFCRMLLEMVAYLIPHYLEEGKSQLVIGIGCTGGCHRSVSVAMWLADRLKEAGNRVLLTHRDVKR